MNTVQRTLLLAITAVAAACTPDAAARDPLSPTHPRMVVTSSTVTCPDTVSEGQTAQCVAYFYDENHNLVSNTTPSWSSTNTSVLTVNASGQITGVAVGSATVQATYSGVTGSKGVYVKPGISGSIGGPGPVQRFATCSWYVLASGGTAPYTYSWHAGGASPIISSGDTYTGAIISAQATFTVTITDANGVTKVVSRVVTTAPSAPAC